MIPKIIHYCWFGGGPLPEEATRCIESWKKFCPDYEIREWNESNFDISACTYVKEAYEAKKWAFVSDYVRLAVLVEYGGIYMDTDVEVIKPLDEFLGLEGFSGFENGKDVPTGIMACEKNQRFVKELLDAYSDLRFVDPDGVLDLTTNVTRITNACVSAGLKRNNQKQTINGFTLFPKDVFCPLDYVTGQLKTTDATHTIHWFTGSWMTSKDKRVHEKAKRIRREHGRVIGTLIANVYEGFYKITGTLKEGGLKALNKRIKKYIAKKRARPL